MDERYRLWDELLARWPRERVQAMTLDEYVVGSGNKDTFCYQLEAGTERLGSIWGGSSFKFGVYRLKHAFKAGRAGYMTDGTYAWVGKYGSTAEEAFDTIRKVILEVMDAVSEGPDGASKIDAAEISHMLKWKVAFLYQDRSAPWVVPIYKTEAIAGYLGSDARKSHGELMKMLHGRGMDDVFALADRIWEQWENRHDAALQSLLEEIRKKAGLSSLEEIPEWLERHPREELSNRTSFLSAAREMFDRPEAEIQPALKSLAKTVLLRGHGLISSMVNEAVKWEGMLPLIRQMRDREEPFDEAELDQILDELNAGPFLKHDGKPKKDVAALFLSLLLQARWPEHFIEYRKWSINALADRLHYDRPSGTMGARLVKAGAMAKEVRALPAFRRLWGERPFADAVVSTLAYALKSDKWPEFLKPDHDSTESTDPTQPEGEMSQKTTQSKNQILYGPPGTGKTYITRKLAVEICDGAAPESRDEVKTRYDELYELGRIRFVTFHQSFSYEDFVEGIRPLMSDAESGHLRYRVEDGIFKRICTAASRPGRKFSQLRSDKDLRDRKYFKMSVGGQQDPDVEEYCLENGIIALGWGGDVDYSKYKTISSPYQKGFEEIRRAMADHGHEPESKFAIQAVWFFRDYMQEGDIVIVGDGLHRIKAIGEVVGPYEYSDDPELGHYHHIRRVNWLRTDLDVDAHDLVGKRLSQQTIYSFDHGRINFDLLERLITVADDAGANVPYVLIIDEINRANISKVFGELITLIEDDKRLGAKEEIKVRLPYSREDFGVPSNLYIIGTMNTADRSIASLDAALRRRFVFKEMMPNPCLLHVDDQALQKTLMEEYDGRSIEEWETMSNWDMNNKDARWAWDKDYEGEDLLIKAGNNKTINLRRLLYAMNTRIETLYDRDHKIGHAYLMGVKSLEDLADRFEHKIIPLLQEYFFDDWEKIRKVLADDQKENKEEFQFVLKIGEGKSPRFRLNRDALKEAQSYIGIYDQAVAQEEVTKDDEPRT